MRGAEPLVFGHAELFLKARALIDHGWIGRLAETEEGGEAVAAAPFFHPKKVRKMVGMGLKIHIKIYSIKFDMFDEAPIC